MQDQNSNPLQTPVMRFKAQHMKGNLTPCLSMPPSPFLKRLGFGTGVSVYLVERSPRQGAVRSPWAVKKIHKTNQSGASDLYARRMKMEAAILKKLDHKNIVGFRALGKAKDGMLCLALEDAEKCLFSMIEERMETDLGPYPPAQIMKVGLDVADALDYLHNRQKLLHGDIKSGNVLIKGDFDIAKLCDFGVAIQLDENLQAESSLYVGTDAWSAQEALMGRYVSDKSDIYSYGSVIFEMLSLDIPHADIFPTEEEYPNEEDFEAAFEEAENEHRLSMGTRPRLPQREYGEQYRSAIELFFVCTEQDSSKRPSAKQILSELLTNNPTCKLDFEDSD